MPAKHLTDAFIRNVRLPSRQKGERQITYIDTIERGLALLLVVSYGGAKVFRVGTYIDGIAKDGRKVRKLHTVKLGTYPQMSEKEARKKAKAYFADPQTYAAKAAVGSFKEVAENWFKRRVQAQQFRSHKEIKRQLEKYVYPRWGDRKFLEIRRRDVNELLDHVADNHGRVQADAVLATLRSIMIWHQSRDEDYVSPIVKGMQQSNKKSRTRILNDNEIRALWQACSAVNGTFGALIKVLLLTAQRRAKVATMRWSDLTGDEWIIHAEEREKGTPGTITLPSMVLELIAAQPRIAGNPYVFPGRGKGPFHSFSQRKQELDEQLPDMEPWVVHDLRRSARSLMSRAGVSPNIAERVLGHALPGVEGIYDRHVYGVEKADALNKLAALIQTIINPPSGNVVALRR
jgi:integrase